MRDFAGPRHSPHAGPHRFEMLHGQPCRPPGQSGEDRRQTPPREPQFASRQRRYRDALLCICREASIPTDVSIEDGSHAMKPILMLLIGGSPPLLARGFRRALGARRAPVRTRRRLAPTIMPADLGDHLRHSNVPGRAELCLGPNRCIQPCTRRGRISSCTSVRALNLRMQTSFNTDCLPAESEHWRAQAFEVRGGGSASRRSGQPAPQHGCAHAPRAGAPGCAHAPGAVRDAEVRGRGCDGPDGAVIFNRRCR